MGGCNCLLLNQIARPHGRVQLFIIKQNCTPAWAGAIVYLLNKIARPHGRVQSFIINQIARPHGRVQLFLVFYTFFIEKKIVDAHRYYAVFVSFALDVVFYDNYFFEKIFDIQ